MPALLEPPKTESAPKVIDATEKTRDLINTFAENWVGRPKAVEKPPEPVVEVKPEVKTIEKANLVTKDEPAKVEEPKAESPVVVAPVLDSKTIADSVGRAVSEALKSEREASKYVAKAEKAPLPESELKRQRNLETLQTLYPDQYKGIADERAKFLDSQRAYEEKWIADNPGLEFDPNSGEHTAFFEGDPISKVETEHMAEAIAEQRISGERQRTEERIRESETRARVIPQAEREGSRAATNLAKTVGGKEFAGLVNADGTVNKEKFSEINAADPIRAPIVAQAATAAANLSSEVVKLYNGVVKHDPKNNPMHQHIAEFGSEMEQRMKQVDPKKWVDSRGRKQQDFVTSVEYQKLSREERRTHWTFDQQDMVELMTLDLQSEAQKIISAEESKIEAFAKRRGFQPVATKKEAVATTPSRIFEPTVAVEKPHSPSSSTEPKMAGVKGLPRSDGEKLQDAFFKNWIGR